MRGKFYRKLKEQVPAKAVNVLEAVTWIKEHARDSFDETIELHVRLGVEAGKSDQMVRGNVVLPSGAVKTKRIAVFTADREQQAAAKEAGASIVGGEELIAQVKEEGKLDADIVVAAAALMGKVASVARVLGPAGLMPNPKTGTVSPDPVSVVRELVAGKLSFKMDTLGNIHESVGKVSWKPEAVVANVDAVLQAIREARPSSSRGALLKRVTLASTMGPGITVAQ